MGLRGGVGDGEGWDGVRVGIWWSCLSVTPGSPGGGVSGPDFVGGGGVVRKPDGGLRVGNRWHRRCGLES